MMRPWGASQWVFYLWGCHQQPIHEIVTLWAYPLHQIQDQKTNIQNFKMKNKEKKFGFFLFLGEVAFGFSMGFGWGREDIWWAFLC